MKNSRIYNLALPPNAKILHKASATCDSSPLLAKNIFSQERSNKWKAHELQNSKSYEVVGLNQLRSYQQRMKKMTRLYRTDSLSTDRAVSKTSSDTKKGERNLLTKEQVMKRLPKLEKEEQHDQVDRKPKRKRQSWMTFSTQMDNFQENLAKQILTSEKKKHEFSLSHLKERFNSHKKEWSKNFRNMTQKEKFPSLFQSIEQFRAKIQEKEEFIPSDDLVNTRSHLWGNTLRKTIQLTNLCKKKIATKTFYNQRSFLAKGSSKIQAEKQWLQEKDLAGFKFKVHASQAPDDSKKVVVIR